MRGEGDVVVGWKNKVRVALAGVVPIDLLAVRHPGMPDPGSAGQGR